MAINYKTLLGVSSAAIGLATLSYFLFRKNTLPLRVIRETYRDTSMDFLKSVQSDIKDPNSNISKKFNKDLEDVVNEVNKIISLLPDPKLGIGTKEIEDLKKLQDKCNEVDKRVQDLRQRAVRGNLFDNSDRSLYWFDDEVKTIIELYATYCLDKKSEKLVKEATKTQADSSMVVGGLLLAGMTGLLIWGIIRSIRSVRDFEKKKFQIMDQIREAISTEGYKNPVDAKYVKLYQQDLIGVVRDLAYFKDTIREDIESAQYYDQKMKDRLLELADSRDRAVRAIKKSSPNPDEDELNAIKLYREISQAYQSNNESQVLYGSNKTQNINLNVRHQSRMFTKKPKGVTKDLADDLYYQDRLKQRGITGQYGRVALEDHKNSKVGNFGRDMRNAVTGDIKGTVGGAVIGGTLGSVVPGIGTMVGAGAGAAIGGLAGKIGGVIHGRYKRRNKRALDRFNRLNNIDAEVERHNRNLNS